MANFEYNGKIYHEGAAVWLNVDGIREYDREKRLEIDKHIHNEQFIFLSYIPESRLVKVLKKHNGRFCVKDHFREDVFRARLLSITDGAFEIRSKRNDSQSGIVVVGWIIYLTLLVFSAIFEGRVLMWIILTFVFSWWKCDKF